MKSRNWTVGPAILAMALGTAQLTSTVTAQPGTAGAAKKARGGKARRSPLITPMMLPKILGKPLTAEQKEEVAKVAKTYHEGIAKAVGLTPAELQNKAKAFRKAQGKAKQKA